MRVQEAVQRIFRTLHDRLATDVEGGVDDDGAAGLLLKGLDEIVVTRVLVAADGLDTRGAINVRDRRNLLSLCGERICDDQHVGTFTVQIKIIGYALLQNGRRKRTERLAELDFQVHFLPIFFVPRIRDNRPVPKRAWAEFHSSL